MAKWTNDGRRWTLWSGYGATLGEVFRVYTVTPNAYQVLVPQIYPSHRSWKVLAEMPRLKDAMDYAMVLYKLEN